MDGPLSTQFISRTTVDSLPAGDIKSINKAAKTVDMHVPGRNLGCLQVRVPPWSGFFLQIKNLIVVLPHLILIGSHGFRYTRSTG